LRLEDLGVAWRGVATPRLVVDRRPASGDVLSRPTEAGRGDSEASMEGWPWAISSPPEQQQVIHVFFSFFF
jgi:hypothetical protein